MVRYLQSSDAVLAYGIEQTPYSKATNVDQYLGYVREDVEPPNPNPITPMSTSGGRRGPHVNSPDPREYSWDVPVQPVDEKTPYEVALGGRTTTTVDPDGTAASGDEYQKDLIEEADRLPTMTVGHWQSDGTSDKLEAYYTGTKASLSISGEMGEPVSATLSCTAAGLEATSDVSSSPTSPPALGVPRETPYRFWMMDDVDIDLASDGSDVKTLGTASSFEFSWDNGLEANHHGNGRDAYSISESTAEEKYEMTLGATITDMGLYERAYEDEAPVDVEVLLNKDPDSSAARADHREAMYVRLLGCTVIAGPSPVPGEGKVEAEIGLAPTDTEIEIHTPI